MELMPDRADTASTKTPKAALGKKRTQRVIGFVVAAVVLAIVIAVSAALSVPKQTGSSTVGMVSPSAAADYATAAQQALSNGEVAKAKKLALQALAIDPNNKAAKNVIKQISVKTSTNGSGGGTSPGSGGGSPSGGNGTVVATTTVPATSDLASFLPTSVAGFSVGAPQISTGDASLVADPSDRSLPLTHADLYVHDRGTAAKAAVFTTNVSKRAYPNNAKHVLIHGQTAYFGTRGKVFATIAFADGQYVFEIIMSTNSGKPGTLFDVARKLAQSYRLP